MRFAQLHGKMPRGSGGDGIRTRLWEKTYDVLPPSGRVAGALLVRGRTPSRPLVPVAAPAAPCAPSPVLARSAPRSHRQLFVLPVGLPEIVREFQRFPPVQLEATRGLLDLHMEPLQLGHAAFKGAGGRRRRVGGRLGGTGGGHGGGFFVYPERREWEMGQRQDRRSWGMRGT